MKSRINNLINEPINAGSYQTYDTFANHQLLKEIKIA